MSEVQEATQKTLQTRKQQFKNTSIATFVLGVIAYALNAAFAARIAEEMSLAQRVPTHTVAQSAMTNYAAGAQIALIAAGVCGAVCLCAILLWFVADLLEIAKRENA